MKKFVASLVLALLLSSQSSPQNPVTKPAPDDDATVVKISTDLIQIDVTVTDKNGKVVPNLKAEDFEVFENGQRQSISVLERPSGFAAMMSGKALPFRPDSPQD